MADYKSKQKVDLTYFNTVGRGIFVFHVEMTTKSLLETSRHRLNVSPTVTSSRYALDVVDIVFDNTKDEKANAFLEKYRKDFTKLLNEYRNEKGRISKKDMDNLAMCLPQAFIYKMQITFDFESLAHYLELRTAPGAHYTIREIAFQMLDELPDDVRENIFQKNKNIENNYQKHKKGE